MSTDDFKAVDEIVAARGRFGHPEHLELAWTYLAAFAFETAQRRMAAAIRHVAEMHGAASRYHETLTRSWVHLVAVHMRRSPARTFDAFLADNVELLDSRLLDRHYSPDVLWSEAARRAWAEPDRRPLPAY